ncbi:uncharacterized protein [Eurosta solidaginis]|uniref:uncharacterized protein n=1 Tax=Eurosta solidaginis TaxID=178769 RepID=UPI003531681F
MWLIFFICSWVATTATSFYTPICPTGGPPVCATNGQAYLYFESECKLNAYVYKRIFAGKPAPVRTDIENCLLDCQEIVCPTLYKPVCAQRVPIGPAKTVPNACLVERLACETKQRWVIIGEGACSPFPAPLLDDHLVYQSTADETYNGFDQSAAKYSRLLPHKQNYAEDYPNTNVEASKYAGDEPEYATKEPDFLRLDSHYVAQEPDYSTEKPNHAERKSGSTEQTSYNAKQEDDFAAHEPSYPTFKPFYSGYEANYAQQKTANVEDYGDQGPNYLQQEKEKSSEYAANVKGYRNQGPNYVAQEKDYSDAAQKEDYAKQTPEYAPQERHYASQEAYHTLGDAAQYYPVPKISHTGHGPHLIGQESGFSTVRLNHVERIPENMEQSSDTDDYVAQGPNYATSKPVYSGHEPNHVKQDTANLKDDEHQGPNYLEQEKEKSPDYTQGPNYLIPEPDYSQREPNNAPHQIKYAEEAKDYEVEGRNYVAQGKQRTDQATGSADQAQYYPTTEAGHTGRGLYYEAQGLVYGTERPNHAARKPDGSEQASDYTPPDKVGEVNKQNDKALELEYSGQGSNYAQEGVEYAAKEKDCGIQNPTYANQAADYPEQGPAPTSSSYVDEENGHAPLYPNLDKAIAHTSASYAAKDQHNLASATAASKNEASNAYATVKSAPSYTAKNDNYIASNQSATSSHIDQIKGYANEVSYSAPKEYTEDKAAFVAKEQTYPSFDSTSDYGSSYAGDTKSYAHAPSPAYTTPYPAPEQREAITTSNYQQNYPASVAAPHSYTGVAVNNAKSYPAEGLPSNAGQGKECAAGNSHQTSIHSPKTYEKEYPNQGLEQVPTTYASKEEDYSKLAEIYAAPIQIPSPTLEQNLVSSINEEKDSAYEASSSSYDHSPWSHPTALENYGSPSSYKSTHTIQALVNETYTTSIPSPGIPTKAYETPARDYAAPEENYAAPEESHTAPYLNTEDSLVPSYKTESEKCSAQFPKIKQNSAQESSSYKVQEEKHSAPYSKINQNAAQESASYAPEDQYYNASPQTYSPSDVTSYPAEGKSHSASEPHALLQKLDEPKSYESQEGIYETAQHGPPFYINSRQNSVLSDFIFLAPASAPQHYTDISSSYPHFVFEQHISHPSLHSHHAHTLNLVLSPELYSASTYPTTETSSYSADTENYSSSEFYAPQHAVKSSTYETQGDEYESAKHALLSHKSEEPHLSHHKTSSAYSASLHSQKAPTSHLVLYPEVYSTPKHPHAASSPSVYSSTTPAAYSTSDLSTAAAHNGNSVFDLFSNIAQSDLARFSQGFHWPYGPIYYQPRFTQIIYNAR